MSALQVPARVILASGSPRRHELLRHLIADFEVVVPDIDEERTDRSHPVEHAANLAVRKAQAAVTKAGLRRSGALLIAADTVVFLGDELLEKPADRVEAAAFLRELSGRPHTVCTVLSLLWWGSGGDTSPADPATTPRTAPPSPEPLRRRIDTATLTEVRFHRLSDSDIEWYLSTEEWKDVAGGYRLQGSGAALVSSIRGSYTNVIGLPLEALFSILRP